MVAKKTWALAVVSFIVVACWASGAAAQDAVAQMDALWAKRVGNDVNAKQILAIADTAFAAAPTYDVAWRAAQAAFWICDRTENKEVKKLYGKKAWEWGQKAVELNPNGVEGQTWAGIGVGEYSKGVGIPKAVGEGLAKKFETFCTKAINLNANYNYGAPLRAMGQYYQKLPWPMRSSDKAEDYYKRAIAAAPCMIRSHYYLADLYREDKKWDKARAAAEAGLAQASCDDEAWECGYYKGQLKKLIESLPAK
jgi:tetratricopeptide (TPR) repeat protein